MIRAEVTWQDAYPVPGWHAVGEPLDAEPLLHRSVGWIVADAVPRHVVLAQTLDPRGIVGDLLVIPVGMVRRCVRLDDGAVHQLTPEI